MPDAFHQTAPEPPYPPDVHAFADRLEEIMGGGTYDLDGIVASLNAPPTASGGHSSWTRDILTTYLAELANR
jgi:hypothetical protein